MLREPRSLALRASIIFTSVFAAMIVAVVGLSAIYSWADRGAGNLRGTVIAVDYAAEDLREAGGGLGLARGGRFADLAARNPTLWLVAVKDGHVFTAGPVPRAALVAVGHLHEAIDSVVLRVPGQEMPLAATSLQRRELKHGTVMIAAGGVDPASLNTRESMHLALQPEVLIGLLTVALVSLLAMLIAVPSFTRALLPVTREAAKIVPNDPGRRLQESKAPTEVLPLVRGFNAALDRLEFELGRRKRFIADVAHELRTPLAVVSLQAENLPDGDAKSDLQRGMRRVTQLVAQMLDLERLSLSGQQHASVDLVAVARDVVADLAPIAIAKGYDLVLSSPRTPVTVSGDVHAIGRALTNLIGNSIAHGGGSGAINVVVGEERTVDVLDEGPGVPAEFQSRMFEPFARADSSAEGSGLGLHLTREIMSAHGGEVCLLPSHRGAAFRLSFPGCAS
ncbi:MAG TPA: HAMP domain-containing sensor histidine kinase [Sphingomicrobium sp.]|nr:HAMP domain-containing sensor histidine kinase [Sphingomicrobium sp.]